MKLYKEHVLLIGAFVIGVCLIAFYVLTNSYDQSPTVDGVLPANVELITSQ